MPKAKTTTPTNSITISVYFKRDLLAGLRREAFRKHMSMSEYVRHLVSKALNSAKAA